MLLSAGTKQLGKKNLASGTGEIASMAGKNETKLPGSVPVVGKPLGDQNLINGISGISAKVGQEGARPPAPLPGKTACVEDRFTKNHLSKGNNG